MSENEGIEYANEFYEWNKRSVKVTSIIIAITLSFIGLPSLWLKENLAQSIMDSVFWLFIGISVAFLIYTVSNSLIPRSVRISSSKIAFVYSFKTSVLNLGEIKDVKIKKGNPDFLISGRWNLLRIFLINGKRTLPIYLSEELSKIIVEALK